MNNFNPNLNKKHGSKHKNQNFRVNRRLSQEELAYQLGISQTKLSNIENGVIKKVGVKLLKKVCDFFEVDFVYFLDKKQDPSSGKNNGGVCVDKHISPNDNFPNNILSQVKLLIEENRNKTQRIFDLEEKLKVLKFLG